MSFIDRFISSISKRRAEQVVNEVFPKILYKAIWKAVGWPKLSTLRNLDSISDDELKFYAIYNEFLGVDNESFGEGDFGRLFQEYYHKNKDNILISAAYLAREHKDIRSISLYSYSVREELGQNWKRTPTSNLVNDNIKEIISEIIPFPENPNGYNIFKYRELYKNFPDLTEYCYFMEKMAKRYL